VTEEADPWASPRELAAILHVSHRAAQRIARASLADWRREDGDGPLLPGSYNLAQVLGYLGQLGARAAMKCPTNHVRKMP
jgi:hypothetical protein